jgi:hypothetical protein
MAARCAMFAAVLAAAAIAASQAAAVSSHVLAGTSARAYADKCTADGNRCAGEHYKPYVEYAPCCSSSYECVTAPELGWGLWCVKQSSYQDDKCYKPGERCAGAPGKPYWIYRPCCDGSACVENQAYGWGSFCVGPRSQPDSYYTDEVPQYPSTGKPVVDDTKGTYTGGDKKKPTKTENPQEAYPTYGADEKVKPKKTEKPEVSYPTYGGDGKVKPTKTEKPAEVQPVPEVSPGGTPPSGPKISPASTPPAGPKASPGATPPAGPTVSPSATPPAGPAVSPGATPPAGPAVSPGATPPAGPAVSPGATPPAGPAVSPVATPTAGPGTVPGTGGCNRVRRSVDEYTDAEWNDYLAAIEAMRSSGEYDQFTQTHSDNEFQWHRGAYFLPAHRQYLWEFENVLRQYCPTCTIPYWDWSVNNNRWTFDAIWNRVGGADGGAIPNRPFNDFLVQVPNSHVPVRECIANSLRNVRGQTIGSFGMCSLAYCLSLLQWFRPYLSRMNRAWAISYFVLN